tara:strand:+ start:484 stop:714 length:231 start_codon:yes stop_codon:yes gene_type:complete
MAEVATSEMINVINAASSEELALALSTIPGLNMSVQTFIALIRVINWLSGGKLSSWSNKLIKAVYEKLTGKNKNKK